MDDALRLVSRRRDVLERLCGQPAWKRDLVDDLPYSRSTVDRAIADLSAESLVAKGDGGYVTTLTGRLFLDVVDEASETLATLRAANDWLGHLPPDAPVSPALFADAQVVTSTSPSPSDCLDAAVESLRTADRVRGLSVADNDPRWPRTLYERSVGAESLVADLVMTAEMADYVLDDYADWIPGYRESDALRVRVRETLPFGLFLLDHGDETEVHLFVHDDDAAVVARVSNDTPAAVAWAESLFERTFEAAQPLAGRAD
jgi:predicted transcriptional regulator